MKKLFLSILLFTATFCYGQYSYVVGGNSAIYSIDLQSGCSLSLIAEFPQYSFTDIAVTSSGTLYLSTRTNLYQLIPGNPATLLLLGNFPVVEITGLVVAPDGTVYASGWGLASYDPITKIFTDLGDFTGSVSSAGDLVVFNGKMYMSSLDGIIYEINTSDPALSIPFYDLGVKDLYGMMLVFAKCSYDVAQRPCLIAIEPTDNGLTSQAYMIDMQTKTSFPIFCMPKTYILGSADFNNVIVAGEEISVKDISVTTPGCNGIADGTITVNMIPSDLNVYSFSINGRPDTAHAIFTGIAPGSYSVRIKNQFGCYLDTMITVPYSLYDCVDSLYVPSAFTPNNDGLNDKFKAMMFAPSSDFRMMIYNRFGQLIYHSASINSDWDGTYHSARQPSGVYVWQIQYKNYQGKAILRKGTVVLIR